MKFTWFLTCSCLLKISAALRIGHIAIVPGIRGCVQIGATSGHGTLAGQQMRQNSLYPRAHGVFIHFLRPCLVPCPRNAGECLGPDCIRAEK